MDGKTINNLFIPTAKTSNYGMKLLKVKGPSIWNALPSSIEYDICFLETKILLYF